MERDDVERWLERHREAVHADPHTLLDRCEREVRERTERDAWSHAAEIAEERLHAFEDTFALPASDAFVAREVCHELARELRRREPAVDESSLTDLVSRSVLQALDEPARVQMRTWLLELAQKEEHRAWLEIVRFTHQLARSLSRGGGASRELAWDFDHSYARTAARVASILVEEYEAHAAGRAEERREPVGDG